MSTFIITYKQLQLLRIMTLTVPTAQKLQSMLIDLDGGSWEMGLSMNIQKTKVMTNSNNKTDIRDTQQNMSILDA